MVTTWDLHSSDPSQETTLHLPQGLMMRRSFIRSVSWETTLHLPEGLMITPFIRSVSLDTALHLPEGLMITSFIRSVSLDTALHLPEGLMITPFIRSVSLDTALHLPEGLMITPFIRSVSLDTALHLPEGLMITSFIRSVSGKPPFISLKDSWLLHSSDPSHGNRPSSPWRAHDYFIHQIRLRETALHLPEGLMITPFIRSVSLDTALHLPEGLMITSFIRSVSGKPPFISLKDSWLLHSSDPSHWIPPFISLKDSWLLHSSDPSHGNRPSSPWRAHDYFIHQIRLRETALHLPEGLMITPFIISVSLDTALHLPEGLMITSFIRSVSLETALHLPEGLIITLIHGMARDFIRLTACQWWQENQRWKPNESQLVTSVCAIHAANRPINSL